MKNYPLSNRREFINKTGKGIAAMAVTSVASLTSCEKDEESISPSEGWVPVSDRKVRVGLVGYGACKFGAAFGFQNHPNVEVVAVSDLFPDRCTELAKVTRCNKTYPSLEELVKDDNIEAVFLGTDAPGHINHTIEALNHGKHVGCAVPAVFGSLEDADRLFEAVKASGLKYMMFETSSFMEDLYAMRQLYKAGCFGKIMYTEGEYFHEGTTMYTGLDSPSYKDWRVGVIPQWYPTHSNAYYVGVTDGTFTEVSCLGALSLREANHSGNNQYNNPFATEIALLRTSEGGIARMGVSWDTLGDGGVTGIIRGQRGSFYGKYKGMDIQLPKLERPPLPSGVEAGGHGGSHGLLMDEFITSILLDRKPLVDIVASLNMTVPGIVAHQSAMKNGEWMSIPQYKL